MLFGKKKSKVPEYPYDPERERPVIRASICNGEQLAGFKDRKTGEFHEVMFLADGNDLKLFMEAFSLEHVDKEY